MYKEEEYHKLRTRLAIDRLRVDDELIEHPMLLLEAIEHRSGAEEIRDLVKYDRDTSVAVAACGLRELKYSETRVTSELPTVPEVIRAKERLAEAEMEFGHWHGLVEAMKERGHNLRKFADLTIAGFVAPNAAIDERRRELNQVRENKRRQVGA